MKGGIMRRLATSWSRTLHQLGFRRVVKKRRAKMVSTRRSLIEPLEPRNLLALTVNTLVDENNVYVVGGSSNSLREAIAYATSQQGIVDIEFDSKLSGGTIQLTNGQLSINSPVNIRGLGTDSLTVRADQNANSRVFYVSNVSATISGLTISGGRSDYGGGIYT